MTTLNATKVVVNTTGVYDQFIKQLIKSGYTSDPGEVVFVLHPDKNQSLYSPRNKPSVGQVFLNPTTHKNSFRQSVLPQYLERRSPLDTST